MRGVIGEGEEGASGVNGRGEEGGDINIKWANEEQRSVKSHGAWRRSLAVT